MVLQEVITAADVVSALALRRFEIAGHNLLKVSHDSRLSLSC